MCAVRGSLSRTRAIALDPSDKGDSDQRAERKAKPHLAPLRGAFWLTRWGAEVIPCGEDQVYVQNERDHVADPGRQQDDTEPGR